MSGFVERLTAGPLRFPRRTVVGAAVVAVVAALVGGPVAGLLHGGGFSDPASPSAEAVRLVGQATGRQPTATVVALVTVPTGVASPAGRSEVLRVRDVLLRDPAIADVVDVVGQPQPDLVSRDGTETSLVATLRAGVGDDTREVAKRLQAALAGDSHVRLGGSVIADEEIQDQVSRDLSRAEAVAFPILFLLSLLVFGGLVAAAMPLLIGGLAILVAFLALRAVNSLTELSIFALNLVTGLGLGLAIDASLLILSRYREERRWASDREALRRTLETAGRTVLFSSLTISVALASLLVFPQRFLVSMGIGGIVVTAAASLTALTVLPAVLLLLGDRIDAARFWIPRRRERAVDGFWYRLAHAVMRRPAIVAAAAATLLVASGLPVLGIRFTSVDASVLPASASARQVDAALHDDFPHDTSSPITVVVRAPRTASLVGLRQSVAAVPGVDVVAPPRYLGSDVWTIEAFTRAPALSDSARRIVESVRALPSAWPTVVGGQTAEFVDLQSSLAKHLPLAVAIVILATLVVLFALTGSIVLPLKAVVMSLLSLSAAFGILVVVFQDCRLTDLLHYTCQGALESTQPILLFALAFGLSTDYEVFLLSRIKESYSRGLPIQEAVAEGLERTGRIVTAAALLFCVAIGAFATSQIVFIKELGVGTATAVLLDATIVRALLVPALMALLGGWNWWAPPILRALHDRLAGASGERRAA